MKTRPAPPPPAPDIARAVCIRDGGLTVIKDGRRRQWQTHTYRYSLQDAMRGPMLYLEEACWNSSLAVERLMAGSESEGSGGGGGAAAGKAVKAGPQAVRHRHPLYKLRSVERHLIGRHAHPERLFAAFGVDLATVTNETCR